MQQPQRGDLSFEERMGKRERARESAQKLDIALRVPNWSSFKIVIKLQYRVSFVEKYICGNRKREKRLDEKRKKYKQRKENWSL